MAKGRGSAMVGAWMLLCLLVLYSHMALAAIYEVGDKGGWTFNVESWPKGKSFRARDTLVFNYNPSIHNVVALDKVGYDTCKTSRGDRVYSSGKDQIKLVKGQNYFICSLVGHCESGMKIAVDAV